LGALMTADPEPIPAIPTALKRQPTKQLRLAAAMRGTL
jgi:hypothetical protein